MLEPWIGGPEEAADDFWLSHGELDVRLFLDHRAPGLRASQLSSKLGQIERGVKPGWMLFEVPDWNLKHRIVFPAYAAEEMDCHSVSSGCRTCGPAGGSPDRRTLPARPG